MNYNSRSGRGVYRTVVTADGEASCTCPGFHYRRTCRHLDMEWRRKNPAAAVAITRQPIDYGRYELPEHGGYR